MINKKNNMENIEKNIKPRKAVIAFLLSLLALGLGHIYNGQIKKALFFSFGLLLYVVGVYSFGIVGNFWLYFVFLIIFVALVIFSIINATFTAYKSKEYELKRYNKWYIYLLFTAIVYFSALMAQNVVYETARYWLFRGNTHTNYPSFLAGDIFLVDIGAYRHKEPDYGHLVTFSYVSSVFGKSYLASRIVGLPNDTLIIENQVVKYRNSVPVQLCEEFKTDVFVDVFLNEKFTMEILTEFLPNGTKYRFARKLRHSLSKAGTSQRIIVPENSYLVWGDNRDFSDFKFIEREQIRGRVLAIYFNRRDLTRINRRL